MSASMCRYQPLNCNKIYYFDRTINNERLFLFLQTCLRKSKTKSVKMDYPRSVKTGIGLKHMTRFNFAPVGTPCKRDALPNKPIPDNH